MSLRERARTDGDGAGVVSSVMEKAGVEPSAISLHQQSKQCGQMAIGASFNADNVVTQSCSFGPSNPSIEETVTYNFTIANNNSDETVTCDAHVFGDNLNKSGSPAVLAQATDLIIEPNGTWSDSVFRSLNNPISDDNNHVVEGAVLSIEVAPVNVQVFSV